MHLCFDFTQGNSIERDLPKRAREHALASSDRGSSAIFTERDPKTGAEAHYKVTRVDQPKLQISWDPATGSKPSSVVQDYLIGSAGDDELRHGCIFAPQGTYKGMRRRPEYMLVEAYSKSEAVDLESRFFGDHGANSLYTAQNPGSSEKGMQSDIE
ncbi:hypothetical protein I302_105431 [Kwoniella bestiolae CBS 10118]|uniref:Uncharacterized protein n=1 Tax=Kwoniella bestiolae CBS 10118 TaxID=1296100 RepID=A0A1B9FT40_9TREE|nr:hypothetical protein I302_08712 [Kwoniella bestiolae CBS 10118]OCF21933.1 hypothetical protein I302_08712 [Kwoniella bestiolae CBS 10118]